MQSKHSRLGQDRQTRSLWPDELELLFYDLNVVHKQPLRRARNARLLVRLTWQVSLVAEDVKVAIVVILLQEFLVV